MKYEHLETIKESDKSKIYLVFDSETRTVLVEKHLTGEQLLYKRLQGLSHPYLPLIYGVQFRDGITIVHEEYISGGSLDQVPTMSEKQCVRWMLELCTVLSFLHGHSILHRDIKPTNILLGADGHIRLIDFDAAREEKAEAQSDTRLLGTRGYAPPEQYGFAQTDARADIYSAGITFQLMLGERAKNREYQRIIRTCTQFTPERRYSSAGKLTTAIRRRKFALFGPPILGGVVLLLLAAAWVFIPQVLSGPPPPVSAEERVAALSLLENLTDEWVATNQTPLNGFKEEYSYDYKERNTTGFSLTIVHAGEAGYYATLFYEVNGAGEYLSLGNDQALLPQVVTSNTIRFLFDGEGSLGQKSGLLGYLELSINLEGTPMAVLVLDGKIVAERTLLTRMSDWQNGRYLEYHRIRSGSYMLNSTDTLHPLEIESAYQRFCAGRWIEESPEGLGLLDLYDADIRILEANIDYYKGSGVKLFFYLTYEPDSVHEFYIYSAGTLEPGHEAMTIDGIPYERLY